MPEPDHDTLIAALAQAILRIVALERRVDRLDPPMLPPGGAQVVDLARYRALRTG